MRSHCIAAISLAVCLPAVGWSALIFDSGAASFSATGTQFGRVSRDGNASTWGSAKPFPGVTGAPAARGYEVFTVNSGIYTFLQVSLDDPRAGLFVAAYLGSYNPVNAGPNYGLNVNYLGDPGSSQPFGNPSSFQINVASNSQVVLALNEVNPAAGAGLPFNLIVEGFLDADYNDTSSVPEPGSLALVGAGFGLLMLVRAKRVAKSRGGVAAGVAVAVLAAAGQAGAQQISDSALQQIQSLLQEKQSRTAVQKKLSSALVFAAARARGLTPAGIDTLGIPATSLNMSNQYGALVDIKTTGVSNDLLSAINQAGGRVLYAGSTGTIRARIPISLFEPLAARSDVRSIKAGLPAKSSGNPIRLDAGSFSLARYLNMNFFIGLTTTQGVVTHAANTAIKTSGANGGGVRVGVLSDSAEFIPSLIATGDLPPDAQIVADLIGGPGSSEGSAMMEIVHDMAPGARLYFASAFNGPDSFADNIRLLRNTYNCDIIVDDVGYSDEGVFQDTVIAKAVNDVTQSGALYFSSASNSGNITNATSSTWEGDFNPGPPNGPYILHNFGGTTGNRLLTLTGVVDLQWSDAWGSSSNDYDLFILNAAGTAVIGASTGDQSGTGDPFEEVYNPSGFPANSIVLIGAFGGAQPRALHLENFFGEPLAIATSGQTHGHNAAGGCIVNGPGCTGRAFGVAAVAWNSAKGATKPFVGGALNPTERFSSDGPRRIFHLADGTAITPGNYLFGTNGGRLLVKPDIAAADGVATKTPGFSPFFGTSAAAPHAAGIAAILKSARPLATGAQIYNAMTSTALDIRAPGIDRDSGYGIVMAAAALAALPK